MKFQPNSSDPLLHFPPTFYYSTEREKNMPCFVPFNNKNLDITFFVFKSVGVFVEDLIDALKYFSFFSENHGCTNSAVFKSIHGNLVRPFPFIPFLHFYVVGWFSVLHFHQQRIGFLSLVRFNLLV